MRLRFMCTILCAVCNQFWALLRALAHCGGPKAFKIRELEWAIADVSDCPRDERVALHTSDTIAPAMTPTQRSVLREGIVAGLLGAAVVAVWFLFFDLARGRPLLTPGLLGAAVFQGVTDPIGLEIAPGNVLGYTLLHGLALVALGHSMLGALVWWAILIGNLLASIAMLWYLFRFHRALPATLVGSWGGVLREDVVAGLLGAVVVAVWFLLIDAIEGEVFRTQRLLGTGILGQTGALAAILAYSAVHGLAFVAVGIVGALLIAGAARQPPFVFALVIFFTAFEVFFFGAVVIAAKWVRAGIAGWAGGVAGLFLPPAPRAGAPAHRGLDRGRLSRLTRGRRAAAGRRRRRRAAARPGRRRGGRPARGAAAGAGRRATRGAGAGRGPIAGRSRRRSSARTRPAPRPRTSPRSARARARRSAPRRPPRAGRGGGGRP